MTNKGPIIRVERESIKSIYFMGIAGTGMASAAGLTQQAGYIVNGSDKDVYPPMSTMLRNLNIPVFTPYSENNLQNSKPDLVVVANCLSRGHPEVEYLLQGSTNYTSFPKLIGDLFLSNRHSVVVTGTHGKTTTTSLITHVLREIGQDPGYIIGGIPRNFEKSFHLGSSKTFVIEGDEYDTAFFDKESKFLHYQPKTLIINNLEFDHADIFDSLEDIKTMFKKVINLVPEKSNVICNWDDHNVVNIIKELGLSNKVTRLSCYGNNENTDLSLKAINVKQTSSAIPRWEAKFDSKWWGEFSLETILTGKHNIANIAQTLGCIGSLMECQAIPEINVKTVLNTLKTFKSVKRRLEHIGSINGRDVYEDFAHHPTAVSMIIDNFKTSFPSRRLVVAFEPKNATARRNIFESDYSKELSKADVVLLGSCPIDFRIPEAERMSTERISKSIGKKSHSFRKNDEILEWLRCNSRDGDIIIFMSSGSFSGIQHKTISVLKTS